jgi:hypothetical protein
MRRIGITSSSIQAAGSAMDAKQLQGYISIDNPNHACGVPRLSQ